MANVNGGPGVSRLASVMSERMRRQAETGAVLDFGTIQDDYSLLTDDYPVPIPLSDYLVCRHLTLGKAGAALCTTDESGDHAHAGGAHDGHVGGDGAHSHSGDGVHKHMALVPEKLRSLKPGDRVLVAWRGSDAVVVDLIRSAERLGAGD